MESILRVSRILHDSKAMVLFALLDIICVGFGMGVPLFCIGLGLLVGWYVAHKLQPAALVTAQLFRHLLLAAAVTSAFTLLMMLLIWGPALAKLPESDSAIANFGMPLLLFEPRPSFIAWLALMIVISPFLQFLMTLLGSCVALAWRSNNTACTLERSRPA